MILFLSESRIEMITQVTRIFLPIKIMVILMTNEINYKEEKYK